MHLDTLPHLELELQSGLNRALSSRYARTSLERVLNYFSDKNANAPFLEVQKRHALASELDLGFHTRTDVFQREQTFVSEITGSLI